MLTWVCGRVEPCEPTASYAAAPRGRGWGQGNNFRNSQGNSLRNRHAVLHTFDSEGSHLGSDVWFAGTSENEFESVDRAEDKLKLMLAKLSQVRFTDIGIKLFSVRFDDQIFGLVDGTYTEDGETWERILLVPNDLQFTEPFDGSYST